MHIAHYYVVGLGALGTMYASQLFRHVSQQKGSSTSLKVIVDPHRKERYMEEGVYCNDEEVKLSYVTPQEIRSKGETAPVEKEDPEGLTVFMICTKHYHLHQVAKDLLTPFVDYHRPRGPVVLFTVTNGIDSEGLLADYFGKENVLFAMAQTVAHRLHHGDTEGDDTKKKGYRTSFSFSGRVHLGEEKRGAPTPRLTVIAQFLVGAGIECVIQAEIKRVMWSKFMFNCGLNQVTGIFQGTYGDLQTGKKELPEGITQEPLPVLLSQLTDDPEQLQAIRAAKPWVLYQLYRAAMQEVVVLSQYEPLFEDGEERIALTEKDIQYYEDILKGLDPHYAPSMKMDMEAKRKTEVDVFSGTVIRLGAQHRVEVPVNATLHRIILSMESRYLAS